MKRRFFIAAGVYIALFYGVILRRMTVFSDTSAPEILPMSLLSALGIGTAALALWRASCSLHRHRRRPWVMMAGGVFLHCLGEVLTAGAFAWADAFETAGAGLVLAAILSYLWQGKMVSYRTLTDLGIVVLFSSTLLWMTASARLPVWEKEPLAVMKTMLSLLDFQLMTAVLFFNTHRRYLSRRNLLLGMGLALAYGGQAFCVSPATSGQTLGLLAAPLRPAGFLLMAGAALCPAPVLRNARIAEAVFSRYRVRRAWEYFCLLLPDGLAFFLLFLAGTKPGTESLAFRAAVVAMALVWVRQFLVIRANEHLLILLRQRDWQLKKQNSALAQQNSITSHDAAVDFLTQLYNRRYIDRALNRPKESADGTVGAGLLLIDVDSFKQINDRFGHQEGDQVLTKVADAIRCSLRESDIAGRFGGDEFIILVYDVRKDAVNAIAGRLQNHIHEDGYLAGLGVTVSIGCTVWRGEMREYDPVALLKAADTALYQSKEGGRDRCSFRRPEKVGVTAPTGTEGAQGQIVDRGGNL